MNNAKCTSTVRHVETPSGRISYLEAGAGPSHCLSMAWMAGLSDIRRCISIDLLAHGDTESTPYQDFSVTTNAKMLREVLDALRFDQVDVIGNDSGGGIAQSSRRSIPAESGA